MNTTNRWPLDYDTLNKGDLIPAARVAEITGVAVTNPKFALAMLAVKERIENDMRQSGRPVTLATVKGDLKVLTDAEATQYNNNQFQKHKSGLIRRHAMTLTVDVAHLNQDQRREHDRHIEVQGKYVQAIAAVRKELSVKAHQRTLPTMRPAEQQQAIQA